MVSHDFGEVVPEMCLIRCIVSSVFGFVILLAIIRHNLTEGKIRGGYRKNHKMVVSDCESVDHSLLCKPRFTLQNRTTPIGPLAAGGF